LRPQTLQRNLFGDRARSVRFRNALFRQQSVLPELPLKERNAALRHSDDRRVWRLSLYIARENEVRTIEERIAGCMERRMNGRVLPIGGKERKARVSYRQFLSSGVPVGKSPDGRGSPTLPLLARAADPKRGAEVYDKNCALCHQANGQGQRKGTPGDAN